MPVLADDGSAVIRVDAAGAPAVEPFEIAVRAHDAPDDVRDKLTQRYGG